MPRVEDLLDDGEALGRSGSHVGGIPVASPADITAAVDTLVDGAPSDLSTLGRLAAAIDNDPDFAAGVASALAGKQDASATLTALAALTTTEWGRQLLELADAGAARTALDVPSTADLAAVSGAYVVASDTAPEDPSVGDVWVQPGMAHAAVVASLDLGRVVLFDSFDRPDSETPGDADSGQSWEIKYGNWAVEDGRLVVESLPSAGIFADAGVADLDMEATVTYGGASEGLSFAHNGVSSPPSAWEYLSFRFSGGAAGIARVNPSITTLATGASFTPETGRTYRLRVTKYDDLIIGFVDGEEVVRHTLSPEHFTLFGANTFVGFRASSGPNFVADDLVVRSL